MFTYPWGWDVQFSSKLEWQVWKGKYNEMASSNETSVQLSGYQSHSLMAQRNFGSYLATDSGWVLHACMTKSVIIITIMSRSVPSLFFQSCKPLNLIMRYTCKLLLKFQIAPALLKMKIVKSEITNSVITKHTGSSTK